MKLYEVTQKFIEAQDQAIDKETGEINMSLFEAARLPLEQKQRGCIIWLKKLHQELEAIQNQKRHILNDLQQAEQRKKRQIDGYEKYLVNQLIMSGDRDLEFDNGIHKAQVRSSTSTEIEDPSKLEPRFFSVVEQVKPDKKAIKEAISAGEIVAGARLVEKSRLHLYKPTKKEQE